MTVRIFEIRLPDGRWYYAQAHTRSEARSQAKKDFKLQRLPIGTIIKEQL